jgi:phage shock protein PspC (stress-responsive transcriptional regulator)
VDEIVRIEEELTTRESDLESLEQRRQALGGQVAMSTVTIRISKTSAPATPRQDESSGFLAGVSDGWGAYLDAGAVTLRVIGAVLPFLLVLAVPAVSVIRWWRRRRTTATAAQQP